MEHDILSTFLLVYAGLFPIVDPVAAAPIFLLLTQHLGKRERHSLAGQVAVNSFFLLRGSLFVGSYVLEFFGIGLPALRIAGGLVVTALGWKLLHAGGPGEDQRSASESGRALDAFYPLTMPLTVGPGSISVAITLGTQRPRPLPEITKAGILVAAAIVGLLAMAVTIYLCYRFAERIVAALGPRGTDIMVRLSAFILLCIGIQILLTGVAGVIGNVQVSSG